MPRTVIELQFYTVILILRGSQGTILPDLHSLCPLSNFNSKWENSNNSIFPLDRSQEKDSLRMTTETN
jgi:hypothetical protein